MSQVITEYIPIDKLIQKSDLIIVAQKIDYKAPKIAPAIRPEKFTVKEILYKKSPVMSPEEEILVYPAHYGVMKAMNDHNEKHGTNGMPSPILEGYNSSIRQKGYTTKDTIIIFLLKGDDESTFEFAVDFAYEPINAKEKVLEAIKKK